MLSVCSRLSEDDRSGLVIKNLAEAVHVLSVGLHIELLEVSRHSVKALAVRKNCRVGIAQDVSQIDSDHCIHQSSVLSDIRLQSCLILGMGSVQNLLEDIESVCQRQNDSSDRTCCRIAATDVVIHEENGKDVGIVCKRACVACYGNNMLLRNKTLDSALFHDLEDKVAVGQSFLGGSAL